MNSDAIDVLKFRYYRSRQISAEVRIAALSYHLDVQRLTSQVFGYYFDTGYLPLGFKK